MTQGDIIRMAREANADKFITENFWIFDGSELERFAALVAAAEREACAKVCEESHAFDWPECAAAIRARGQG
jgi:uncharacterized protein YggL (DUF469 family)